MDNCGMVGWARWGLVLGLAAGVAGCSGEAREHDRDRQRIAAFPLDGAWVWADGAPLLPSRGLGCGPGETHMLIDRDRFTLANGVWRQPAFTITGWTQRDSTLTLALDDTISNGKPSFVVALDVSQHDQTRVVAVHAAAGAASDPRGRSALDSTRTETLRSAFQLTRCVRGQVATSAMLRGAGRETANGRLLRPVPDGLRR